jgi:8-oxo-dGTP diphosphatase
MINVTAAIIERNGKILIAKRSSKSSLPNKWEFPGGKVDQGETPEECLKRELYEEFDIIVDVGNFLDESVYQYKEKTVKLMAFQVYTDADITTMNAHDDVKWVPVEELLKYDLAPADVPIAREVQKREW